MNKKDLENLEEKLDDIYGSLSYQNTVLNEIKEILDGFKWLPLNLVIGVVFGLLGWFIVSKLWDLLFGY